MGALIEILVSVFTAAADWSFFRSARNNKKRT